jgi:hypothetical protein
MTTSHTRLSEPSPTRSDATFDRQLRDRYTDAALHLSARTNAQLQQRLRAAIAQRPQARDNRQSAWLLATACTLALVAAIGLQWRAQDAPAPRTPVPVADAGDNGEIVATLEETPDLYLWLASEDAIALASE